MKKLLFLVGLVGLVGCNDVKTSTSSKRFVQLKQGTISAFTATSEYETHPDTFALFFMPEVNELTWSSSLFNDGDTYEDKLTAIMKNVISLSDKRDALDKEIFKLNNQVAPLEAEYEAKGCIDDIFAEGCEDLDGQIQPLNTQIAEKTTLSSDYLKGIQQSVDKDISKPVNWQKYGADAKAYEFDINEETGEVKILMPELGPYANRYSTKDGDIINVVYRTSDYNPNVRILSFKLLEKGADKERNGNYYDFKLEKSSYLNKIRFKGDVVKVVNGFNLNTMEVTSNVQFQRGVCKFELPVKTKK